MKEEFSLYHSFHYRYYS